MKGVRGKGVDANRVVRADGERLAERGLDRGVADRHCSDGSAQVLIELQGTGKAELVVGIDDELHPVGVEGAGVRSELNLGRRIGNVADANEDLHIKDCGEAVCTSCDGQI